MWSMWHLATNLLPYKDVWNGFLAREGDEGAADVASPDFFVDFIDAVPCTSCIVRRGKGVLLLEGNEVIIHRTGFSSPTVSFPLSFARLQQICC